jgi:hypothetical protein
MENSLKRFQDALPDDMQDDFEEALKKLHNDLVNEIGVRVRGLADYKMDFLRKVCEPGVECKTRGTIIEAEIWNQFIKE